MRCSRRLRTTPSFCRHSCRARRLQHGCSALPILSACRYCHVAARTWRRVAVPYLLGRMRKICRERWCIAVLAVTLACSSSVSPGTPPMYLGVRSALGPGRLSFNPCKAVRSMPPLPIPSMLGGATDAVLCHPGCRESRAVRSQMAQSSQGPC